MKKNRILTICLIILIISIIGMLLLRFLNNNNSDSNINSKYYLIATEQESNGKIEILDVIPFELKIDNVSMTFCSEELNECTTVSYLKKNNNYEIDTWGDETLSGTFSIINENNEELIIEKNISEDTKIINYFSSKKPE